MQIKNDDQHYNDSNSTYMLIDENSTVDMQSTIVQINIDNENQYKNITINERNTYAQKRLKYVNILENIFGNTILNI